MSGAVLALGAATGAIALVAAGLLLVGASGARVALALRLAGARQVRVGELQDLDPLPARALRIAGRIRCSEPLTARDERLVALHRDVEVRLEDGGWRTIERVRETRSFELWDHSASVRIDPAQAAEPLVTIPHVWKGRPQELQEEAHRAAVDRLNREGRRPIAARSTTRAVSVVERLLVLARARRGADGDVTLEAPPGGLVISSLELPDAMRLLGGPRRRLMLAGIGLVGLGTILAVAALALLILA